MTNLLLQHVNAPLYRILAREPSRPAEAPVDAPAREPGSIRANNLGSTGSNVPYSRSQCLAALSTIGARMESALEQSRRMTAEGCLEDLRALLAPFDLCRHEVRINARADSTFLTVNLRSDAHCAMPLSSVRGDGLLLDVLQEIDAFLYTHEDWVRYLDGAVLNGDPGA